MSGKHYKKKENKLRKLRDIVKTYSHLNFTCNSLCSVIPPLHHINAYANSGATDTYFRLRDVHNHKNNNTSCQYTTRTYKVYAIISCNYTRLDYARK